MNTNKWKMVVVISLLLAGGNVVAAHGGGGSPGGMSSGHMSSQGIGNTNGPASADRDKGLARAEDRRSANGNAHGKSALKVKHRHHHAPVQAHHA